MACDQPLAEKFEQAARMIQSGEFHFVSVVMKELDVPLRARNTMWDLFTYPAVWTDLELRDAGDGVNWRQTAFCFAAAMARSGDFKA
jgi:hypothetical protein